MLRLSILLSVSIPLLIGCSDSSAPQGRRVQQGIMERAAVPVEMMEVEEQDVVEWIRGVGSVSADKSVTVSAEVGGKVAKVHADVGDLVKKGDVLARLDEERLRIERDRAQSEVEIAQANLKNSRRNARRQADLYKDRVVSDHDVEQADLQVSVDVAELDMAKAKLAAAERDLRDAEIVSPIDGEITRKRIEVGELISPGTPLFDLVDISSVKVAIHVSEHEITGIHKGQAAEIEVDGFPGSVFHGTVHTIAAKADPETHTFPVEILVVNDRPQRLLPGFIARARLRGRTFQGAIFLPREIVVERNGSPTVFVVASESVSSKTVELGYRDRGKVVISKGLKPGDKIVVTGQESLQDGAKVSVK